MGKLKNYQAAENPSIYPDIYVLFAYHFLAIVGVFLYPPTWNLLALFLVMNILPQFGITMGYHRLLTHRSFEFKFKFLEYIFVTLGTLAFQRGPIWWCSIHRIHHKNSDTPSDPHNSRQGFWYSHFLWLLYLDSRWANPRKIENFDGCVKDISGVPYYRWLDHYYFVPGLILDFLLFIIGGWAWIFWGRVIPIVLRWHMVVSVNSMGHLIGYRAFHTTPNDRSKNNWLFAIFTLGDGWHNNHHAFPSAPKHGFFKWWEFDITYFVLKIFNKLGLIGGLKNPTEESINAARLKNYPQRLEAAVLK